MNEKKILQIKNEIDTLMISHELEFYEMIVLFTSYICSGIRQMTILQHEDKKDYLKSNLRHAKFFYQLLVRNFRERS